MAIQIQGLRVCKTRSALSPLPNGVKLPLETTGGSDFLARPHSSDSTRK